MLDQKDLQAIAGIVDKRMEKTELMLRGEMQEMKAGLRGEMQEMKAELRGEMQEMKAELRGGMQEMKTELRGEMQEMKAELRGEMQEMKTELQGKIEEGDSKLRKEMQIMRSEIQAETKRLIEDTRDLLLDEMRRYDIQNERRFCSLEKDVTSLKQYAHLRKLETRNDELLFRLYDELRHDVTVLQAKLA